MRATQIVGVLFLWSLFDCVRATTVPCTPEAFKCLKGDCIKRSEYCNHRQDCRDNSDENYCSIVYENLCPPGWTRCGDERRCFPSQWRCDGTIDCWDASDEENCNITVPCTPEAFKCLNGDCITRSEYCNHRQGCRDNSDENYCSIGASTSCPLRWSRCADSYQCFPSHWRCDGRTDCLDASDEENCGIIGMKLAGSSATKENLISLFKQKRKSGSTTDKWGSQLHRIAVALYLADESIFSPGNSTGQEISYELTIQLLRRLSVDKKMSSEKLALYIHAMMVACMDPRDFYGENLVLELRKRMEAIANYTNPFQILVLCNAGDNMTTRDVDRVTAAFNAQQRPFWTDTQALASLALACLSSRPNLVTDKWILKNMLQNLKRRQFRIGTVDNARTTALVVQALLIHDSYIKGFDLDSSLLTILNSVKKNFSLLNAYYILPVLSNKSLLNVSSSHCKSAPETEEEALERFLDVNVETISVQYSVWIGDKIGLERTWRLEMRQNSSIYDVIETVAKIDNRQKVEYSLVEGKPFVTCLGGLEDDPETGNFWFLHLRSLKSDGQPEMMEQSPVDLKLIPNQEVILWYRPGPWNTQIRAA